MSDAPALPKVETAHPGLGFNLAGLALLAAVGALGLAYGIDALGRAHSPLPALADAGQTMQRNLGGKDLTIPATWFRYGAQDVDGFVDEVALQFTLPHGVEAAGIAVDVTLLPRSRVRASAALLDRVYLHQFMPNQVEGVPGLVGKPLYAADGYAGETVWYDPLSADPFVAKCIAPVAGETRTMCLRTVNVGDGIAAVYSFDSVLLADWRTFDTSAAPWLQRIGLR